MCAPLLMTTQIFFLSGLLHHYAAITMMTPEALIAIVRAQEARRTAGTVVGLSEAQRLRGRITPPGREKTS
jgi:hypothetical protein